jgi:hypothetical protein
MTLHDSLHSVLVHERLLFHWDEWQTTNQCSHMELPAERRVKTLSRLKPPGLNTDHHLILLLRAFVLSAATKYCNLLLRNGGPTLRLYLRYLETVFTEALPSKWSYCVALCKRTLHTFLNPITGRHYVALVSLRTDNFARPPCCSWWL